MRSRERAGEKRRGNRWEGSEREADKAATEGRKTATREEERVGRRSDGETENVRKMSLLNSVLESTAIITPPLSPSLPIVCLGRSAPAADDFSLRLYWSHCGYPGGGIEGAGAREAEVGSGQREGLEELQGGRGDRRDDA